MRPWVFVVLMVFGFCSGFAQKVVRYDLYVKDTLVNYTGKAKRAIAVNGQIPMPTLVFTEGDTAEIHVHNQLKEETSLHWHGVFLPNQEDGVPYLTQLPIKPNTSHVYRFPVIQNGTHWYHSHTALQEQIGMYGSLIFLKKRNDPGFRKGIDDLLAVPVILSDWTDLHPENVHRMLHIASDWFAIQKGSTQSYVEAIKAGHFKTKLSNEWKRMLAMDVSDIYYGKMLMNGLENSTLPSLKAGDKVRFRISNGGASTYFWLHYAGGKITVVASDGNDVEPVEVDRFIIAVSETYDIVLTVPEANISYEFMATAEDRTQSVSMFLGSGHLQLVTPLPKLKYFEGMKMMNGMMKMNGDLDDMGMEMSLNQMDMNTVMYPEITGPFPEQAGDKMKDMEVMEDHDHGGKSKMALPVTLNYAMLRSTTRTSLSAEHVIKEFRFELSGNMNRYIWSLDNRVLSEVDKILIRKGEIIRIVLYNGSMMRHPMHLHGHDFRVINGQGDFAPLKNVIDVMPMETDTLEFAANTEGDWFFHCHILYHMMAGMGRVFGYEGQPNNPLIPDAKRAEKKLHADDRKYHFMFVNDVATNGNDGMLMVQNTRWSIGTEWRLGYRDHHGYETETHVGRYIGKMQWLMPFVGFDWRYRKSELSDVPEKSIFGQTNTKDLRTNLSIGIKYTLPMLLDLTGELYQDGYVRLQLKREDIPVSRRIRAGFMVNSDREYMVDAKYILNQYIGIRTHYDSDMGFGIGVSVNY